MAWVERRGDRLRAVLRLRGQRLSVNLRAADEREAKSCPARLEGNLRLVERGRTAAPPGADLGLFLLSDGKLGQAVEVARPVRPVGMLDLHRTEFTAGAKGAIAREMESIHLNHLTRILGGETPVAARTAGSAQAFVDARSQELHWGAPGQAEDGAEGGRHPPIRLELGAPPGKVPTEFADVDLVFPKEKQPEPFRTYDRIQAILARGGIDERRERELWDGLLLDPRQVAEVLEHVRRKPNTKCLHPFLVAARCGPGDGPTLTVCDVPRETPQVSVTTASTRSGVVCTTHHSFAPDDGGGRV